MTSTLFTYERNAASDGVVLIHLILIHGKIRHDFFWRFLKTITAIGSTSLIAVVFSETLKLQWLILFRALQEYKQCTAPVTSMCPVGVQTIFAVSSEWDKNVQLATYTCDTALEGLLHVSYRCYTVRFFSCLSYFIITVAYKVNMVGQNCTFFIAITLSTLNVHNFWHIYAIGNLQLEDA